MEGQKLSLNGPSLIWASLRFTGLRSRLRDLTNTGTLALIKGVVSQFFIVPPFAHVTFEQNETVNGHRSSLQQALAFDKRAYAV